MKVGFVGPDELKWPTSKQIKDAQHWIMNQLWHMQYDFPLVVVSGRCPISKCEFCGRSSLSNGEDALTGYVICEFCGKKMKRRAGGVDIWTELIAGELELQTQIFPSKCTNETFIRNGHEEVHHLFEVQPGHYWTYHYKPRNKLIAETVHVLYCVVPFDKNTICRHGHGPWSLNHPENGGCLTMQIARDLGKEVHLEVLT